MFLFTVRYLTVIMLEHCQEERETVSGPKETVSVCDLRRRYMVHIHNIERYKVKLINLIIGHKPDDMILIASPEFLL